jgi:hypothetical protein
MNRKMDYQVVTSGDLSMERAASALADRIGRLIDQGWEPTGGVALVSVQSINDKPYYEVMQAVIRRIE